MVEPKWCSFPGGFHFKTNHQGVPPPRTKKKRKTNQPKKTGSSPPQTKKTKNDKMTRAARPVSTAKIQNLCASTPPTPLARFVSRPHWGAAARSCGPGARSAAARGPRCPAFNFDSAGSSPNGLGRRWVFGWSLAQRKPKTSDDPQQKDIPSARFLRLVFP